MHRRVRACGARPARRPSCDHALGALPGTVPDLSRVEVVPDALFVQDGPFITGAGITAGIDLGLAMVESDYGPDVARRVARWMVVFLQRPGGQTQFSVWTDRAAGDGRLREILDAMVADPGADHSIAAMAPRPP